jgi:sterol desaturase/sphingolipid hydroxylase (fatty acid hydroxylase superfamily)
MNDFTIQNEAAIRFGFFVGVFAAVAIAEVFAPRRSLLTSKSGRWFANLGIVFIDTALLRLFFPMTAVAAALWVEKKGWGLLNLVDQPFWIEVVLSILILDFVIYLQHVGFHAIPTLWRLHMMHHADLDIDLTTGTRFHPIEIFISMGIKVCAVVLIGAPALGVILFEVLLNATAMFNHGNFFLPLGIDRVLRLLLVTPDMHRVHHSVFPSETNSNFGFNMPWWDRIMGTYRPQPTKGHNDMTIGLNQFRDPTRLTLGRLLILPFFGKQGSYALNRRGGRTE